MLNFNFYNPTEIIFGKNRLDELDKHIPQNAKVLITYGGGSVKKYGTLEKVEKALNSREVFKFGGIEVNPRFSTLLQAVQMIKNNNIDFLLAVGGGSVLDGTKFIALASKYKGKNIEDLLHHGFSAVPTDEALPMGTVLTLPATGSEMNCGAVISHKEGKYQVISPLTYPKFSFLDPTLTYTLPKKQVTNGVADAFVHTIEQYLTYPVNAQFQDRTAEGILKTLIEISDDALNKPEDYNTRANLVWSSTMALNGLIGSGVPQDWATHMIGHELTAAFGIDHARTLAIVLPSLLRERKEQKREKLLQYANRVWNISKGCDEEKMEEAIVKTEEFFLNLDIPVKFSAYGIKTNEIEQVIHGLKDKNMNTLGETDNLSFDVSRRILLSAF